MNKMANEKKQVEKELAKLFELTFNLENEMNKLIKNQFKKRSENNSYS